MSEYEAWEAGWDAHFAEVQMQKHDPTHPITRENPYRESRNIIEEIRARLDEIEADPHHYGHTVGESWDGCGACTRGAEGVAVGYTYPPIALNISLRPGPI